MQPSFWEWKALKLVAILSLLAVFITYSPVIASDELPILTVIDGDTLNVQIGNKMERVRIIGIDAPEIVGPLSFQCFGQDVKARLKELLIGKIIKLKSNPAEERDAHGRLLGYVEVDGEDIGALLVKDGYVRVYREYSHPRLALYDKLEEEAHMADRGLWADCDANKDVPVSDRIRA